jgi:hypothetical protein
MTKPSVISPVQWDQALGLARQSCAHIFRDGGSPADALSAFGLAASEFTPSWDRVIEAIAQNFCSGHR